MDAWIWAVIIAVIVLIVLAGVLAGLKKKNEAKRVRAQELREDAAGHTDHLDQSRRDAEVARLEAEKKRTEAERAEAVAAEREKARDADRALHEEQLREADRLDPDVDHTAPDYRPETADDETLSSADERQPKQDPSSAPGPRDRWSPPR